MARIALTSHLRAVGPTTPVSYRGRTVAELLAALSADYPLVRGYVLDDQGRLRKHVAVFVDGVMRPRASALDLALTEDSEVYILQALSGG
jgi:sulfur carrier protein ThiS